MPNMALNLAPFGRWTLRDKAAQRRLALRWVFVMHEPKDSLGKAVTVGARARLLFAAPELIDGLPESDQTAIQSVVGKEMVVEEFDQYGHAELMFNDEQGQIHFIWVKPSDLEVLS